MTKKEELEDFRKSNVPVASCSTHPLLYIIKNSKQVAYETNITYQVVTELCCLSHSSARNLHPIHFGFIDKGFPLCPLHLTHQWTEHHIKCTRLAVHS